MTTSVEPQWYRNRKALQRSLPGEQRTALERVAIRTQKETARLLGVTRQNVQQTERRALWKIRRALAGVYRETIA